MNNLFNNAIAITTGDISYLKDLKKIFTAYRDGDIAPFWKEFFNSVLKDNQWKVELTNINIIDNIDTGKSSTYEAEDELYGNHKLKPSWISKTLVIQFDSTRPVAESFYYIINNMPYVDSSHPFSTYMTPQIRVTNCIQASTCSDAKETTVSEYTMAVSHWSDEPEASDMSVHPWYEHSFEEEVYENSSQTFTTLWDLDNISHNVASCLPVEIKTFTEQN